MSGSQFNITNAVRNAYIFVGSEWRYLARIALLPVGVDALTTVLLLMNGRDMSTFETFSWGLPSSMLTGWYMFHLSRLLMMGERVNKLPADPDYLASRRRGMNASIIVWLLFCMGLVALLGFQSMLMQSFFQDARGVAVSPPAVPLWAATLSLLIFGGTFWCIRYGVAHILAAVDYPVTRYIRRVAGLGISFRLAGMAFLAVLPVIAVFKIISVLVVPDNITDIYDPRMLPLALLSAPVQMLMMSLLAAAGGFALKDIMERKP